MSEEELIRRSQAGDWNAFEQLLERHRTALARTAYLATRDRESIQDVIQEALIQIWRDIPSYKPYGSFRAWTLKILLNKAKKHYRKKQVYTVELEAATEVSDEVDGPEETIERVERTDKLRQALGQLSTDHHEVLVLRFYNELTIPEIAVTLDCAEGTVKSRLSRALKRLEKALGD